MNTKTMRLPPRRVVTSSTNKRKEREGCDSLKPLPPQQPQPQPHPPPHLNQPPPSPVPAPPPLPSRSPKPAQPGSDKPSNQLLAGYLAHEFLTRGTLLGQPWDPARADPAEPKRAKPSEESYRRYVELSSLLKAGDGAHLPGIVNPTQLARILQ